ncbi:LysR family transcriptional regulator [Yinghuangia sp. YIM S09857]|uniref:LysR family transcriptional regulator n=1 Tax=Yinghuangia sp. YIM S09857 TaxID=3436929 RepID=UPI003F5388EB
MLDVRRLRLLRELAHRGTIAAVADALAFTPSAVSQQLSALEREAGVPLLERTGRSVTLTPAATALVVHADTVLAHLEQAAAELAAHRGAPAGPLRIGTFPSAARTLLPAALTRLARDHPALEPHVAELDPAHAADRLRAGDLDAALLHRYDFAPEPTAPGIQTSTLFTEPLYLATRTPTDPTATAPGTAPADPLTAHRDAPWILATPGTLCHTMTVRACEAAGFTPAARHHIDDFTAVLALVAAGQGVALVPRLGIADTPPHTVAAVRLTELPLTRETRLAHRAGAAPHPAIRALARALALALRRHADPPPTGDDGPMETFVRVTARTDDEVQQVRSLLAGLRAAPPPPGFETDDGTRTIEAVFDGDQRERLDQLLRGTGLPYVVQADDE